jgi:hypothetical protein
MERTLNGGEGSRGKSGGKTKARTGDRGKQNRKVGVDSVEIYI